MQLSSFPLSLIHSILSSISSFLFSSQFIFHHNPLKMSHDWYTDKKVTSNWPKRVRYLIPLHYKSVSPICYHVFLRSTRFHGFIWFHMVSYMESLNFTTRFCYYPKFQVQFNIKCGLCLHLPLVSFSHQAVECR